MTLTKKQIIWIAAALSVVIAATAYYFYVLKPRRENQLGGNPQTPETDSLTDSDDYDDKIIRLVPNPDSMFASYIEKILTAIENDPATIKNPFPLKLGSTGRQVEQLQIYLMKKSGGFPPEKLNGIFDKYTLEKLLKHCGRDQMSEQNFYKREIDQERTYKFKDAC